MNYADLPAQIAPKVKAAVDLINNPEIDPEIRQFNLEILLREVGQAIYAKIYDMNAWDMEIAHTTGKGMDQRYLGLAKYVSGTISTGGSELTAYLNNYLTQSAAKAQEDASKNAYQSGKRPTVRREMRGETCDWCQSLAGTYTDPSPEVFARHKDCDCAIYTSGYNSRNGLLKNYTRR